MRLLANIGVGITAVLLGWNIVSGQTPIPSPTIAIEPTAVEFGKYTQIEHAWSKAYRRGTPSEKGELRRTVEYAKEHGVTDGMGISGVGCCGGMPGEPPPPLERLRKMSCGADAIVLGSAKRARAHMMDDESYVYTAYDFTVKEVLRDNSANHIEIGTVIQVTRPGGVILVDGIKIQAEMEGEEPLLPGPDYVFMLRYVPAAKGYMLADGGEIYVINGKSYEAMALGCVSSGLPRKGATDELLSYVRTAAVAPCDAK